MDYYVGRLSDEYDFLWYFFREAAYHLFKHSLIIQFLQYHHYSLLLSFKHIFDNFAITMIPSINVWRPQFSASNPQLRSVAIWEAVRTKFWVTYGSWKLPLPLLFVCSYHMWYARSRSLQHSWVHGLNANSARVIEDCDIWIQSTALNQKRFL